MKDEAALFYRPQWHQTLALMGKKLLTQNFLIGTPRATVSIISIGNPLFPLSSIETFALQLRTPPNT
jgi:hypothetical protein